MLSSLATAAGLARPKKKFHFDVHFLLEELLNCTYLTGVIFAKIRLRDGGTFISDSRDVKSHCIKWSQSFHFHSKMYASPTTGELEPCYCKVSIRKETKGGRSYKKLGYVKINLAEYAGAATQRKYLLESYNEYKHKPDNSILQVTISLKQTSGDNLFKVPQGAGEREWELSENPTDEGIQPDITSLQPRLSYTSHTSTQSSSLGPFNIGGEVTGGGGSLQDVRETAMLTKHRKTSSACNLRRPSISDLPTDSIQEETGKPETTPPQSGDNTPHIVSPHALLTQKPNRSSSFNSGAESSSSHQPEHLPSGLLLQHRRLGSWSQAANITPPTTMHRRQQSLVSGQSSKSTSAYSTLSERSGASMEIGADVESMSGSLKGRLTLLATSSRVEQSRVDPQAVINNLFSGQTFDSKEPDKAGGGLKIYVDRNSGIVTLAGPNLDRKNSNLQAIDVSQHKSTSPKRRHRKSSHSTTKDGPIHSRESSTAEQSPPPSSSSSSHSQLDSSRSSSSYNSVASTKTLTPPS